MTVNVFAVPVFFIVFRETLETSIIVAVLLAFLKQTCYNPDQDITVYRRLVRQVWIGTITGFLITLAIGGGLIGAFYHLGRDHWASTEYYWEAAFSILASIIITLMGAALLRVSKMQEKWRVKLAKALQKKSAEEEEITGILREGIEAIVFVAGVSFSAPATSVPLPVFVGLAAGSICGYVIYRGGSKAKLQYFLIASTCILYLVAAGLFSRAIWYLEAQQWNNHVGGSAAEVGAGPGSYNIDQSIWHINGASPEYNGGGVWGILNSLVGWQNSATYGSVISYNIYWIVVILGFLSLRYQEVKGHWPLIAKRTTGAGDNLHINEGVNHGEFGHQEMRAVEEVLKLPVHSKSVN
ncbi:hypothetical protein B7463_g2575, partial [Scytalidium lignicola]